MKWACLLQDNRGKSQGFCYLRLAIRLRVVCRGKVEPDTNKLHKFLLECTDKY